MSDIDDLLNEAAHVVDASEVVAKSVEHDDLFKHAFSATIFFDEQIRYNYPLTFVISVEMSQNSSWWVRQRMTYMLDSRRFHHSDVFEKSVYNEKDGFESAVYLMGVDFNGSVTAFMNFVAILEAYKINFSPKIQHMNVLFRKTVELEDEDFYQKLEDFFCYVSFYANDTFDLSDTSYRLRYLGHRYLNCDTVLERYIDHINKINIFTEWFHDDGNDRQIVCPLLNDYTRQRIVDYFKRYVKT